MSFKRISKAEYHGSVISDAGESDAEKNGNFIKKQKNALMQMRPLLRSKSPTALLKMKFVELFIDPI